MAVAVVAVGKWVTGMFQLSTYPQPGKPERDKDALGLKRPGNTATAPGERRPRRSRDRPHHEARLLLTEKFYHL